MKRFTIENLTKDINMKRMKAWFEFTADKIETHENEI